MKEPQGREQKRKQQGRSTGPQQKRTSGGIVERTIVIEAERSTVFSFFLENELFAQWWGNGSRVEPRPGGEVLIVYPDGTRAGGQVIEISPPERFVFSYGYAGEGKPIPIGGSVVSITLTEVPEGTRLELRHEVATQQVADMHVPGWRYQLAVFAYVASRRQLQECDHIIDAYFAAWSTEDDRERERLLALSAEPAVRFVDNHGCVSSRAELIAHIAQVRRFFPGAVLRREGETLRGHGTALCAWKLETQTNARNASGTNLFLFSPPGRIRGVVGYAGRLPGES